jgi:hypothetical protein
MNKKFDLDDATLQIMKRMLNAPPKPHEDMKLGREKKRRPAKSRTASAKRLNASRIDHES